jgi:voltage-gated potassium channel Kch
VAWLGVVVFGIIAVGTVVSQLLLGQHHSQGLPGGIWETLVRVLDSSAFEGESAWPSRFVALTITMAGILIGGSLIGLIATALDQRVSDLGTGRSAVLEANHTLILGWSARLPVIVQELVVANQSVRRAAIVVLAPRGVREMEAEIRDRIGDTKNTKVVCRSGHPAKPADLKLANIAAARSVIVLTDEDGDAGTVKAILAIKTLDPDFTRCGVVAEFASSTLAASVRTLTGGALSTVSSDDVIAQVTAQACHQSGLAAVLRDLLDFGGDECYFAEVPQLVGHSYAEALLAFPTSSVVGRFTAGGAVELNPAPGTLFEAGDQVIAVSADDTTVAFAGFASVAVPQRRAEADGQAPIGSSSWVGAVSGPRSSRSSISSCREGHGSRSTSTPPWSTRTGPPTSSAWSRG